MSRIEAFQATGNVAIVTGGRDYADAQKVHDFLEAWARKYAPVTAVYEGGAKGADRLAHDWCLANGVPVRRIAADWAMHGRKAGPLRNREMIRQALATGGGVICIAFPGGRGTADMVAACEAAGITVVKQGVDR
jgi:YspA, cpYpsA-related SLOG family